MTPEDFRAWHELMGYTYDTGAQALGTSRATYARLCAGGEVDRRTALACAALAAGMDEWAPAAADAARSVDKGLS
jgi:hypothetical protein